MSYFQSELLRPLRGWRQPAYKRFAARGQRWPGPRYVRKYRWKRDLIFLTSQLYSMVRANAPFVEGLGAAIPSTPTAALEQVVLALRADLNAGRSLSDAMGALTRFFPAYFVDIAKSGEESGTLGESLNSLLAYTKRHESVTKILRGWLFYISFVLVFQIALSCFLAVRILPLFMDVFKDFGGQLPPVMRFTYEAGQLIAYWWWVIIIGVLLILFPRRWLPGITLPNRRRAWRRVALRIPLIGAVHTWDNLAHIASVLGRLLDAGVPIDRAFDDVAALDVDPYFRGVIRRVNGGIQNGLSLSDATKRERGLPLSFRTMISVGDAAGMVPQALEHIAVLYDRQARTRSRILVDTIAPVGVLLAAAVALTVSVAIYSTTSGLADLLANSI